MRKHFIKVLCLPLTEQKIPLEKKNSAVEIKKTLGNWVTTIFAQFLFSWNIKHLKKCK